MGSIPSLSALICPMFTILRTIVASALMLLLVAGCQSEKDRVNLAMADLQIALKAYRDDGGRPGPLKEAWGRIDPTGTPEEFQEAFRKARADYEHLLYESKDSDLSALKRLVSRADKSLQNLRDVAKQQGAVIREDVILAIKRPGQHSHRNKKSCQAFQTQGVALLSLTPLVPWPEAT